MFYYFLILCLCCLYVSTVNGAAMTDSIYGLIPDSCKDSCAPWTNETVPCVEKAGALSGSYEPISGTFNFDGNKIALYFCLCSSEAVDKSSACLQCVSEKYCLTPPLTTDYYKSLCSGQGSLSDVVKNTKIGCTPV